jgi:Bacterial Ig-like domain
MLYYADGCASPLAFGADLPDGEYYLDLVVYDKAYNPNYQYLPFEVDTVKPKFVSGKPTGTLVSPYADVVVTFDDNVYDSKGFVNIYKKGSSTPLAVYRYGDGDKKIEVSPKNSPQRGTWYPVKVTTRVNDGANNLATPKTWSFKTRG